jgi:hypothetical protein
LRFLHDHGLRTVQLLQPLDHRLGRPRSFGRRSSDTRKSISPKGIRSPPQGTTLGEYQGVNRVGLQLNIPQAFCTTKKSCHSCQIRLFNGERMPEAMKPWVQAGSKSLDQPLEANVTSSAGIAPMQLGAIYAASKCAVEGFTESLSYETEPVGIRMRLSSRVWRPSTNFGANNSPIPNVPDIDACHWTAALFGCYYGLDDFLPGLLATMR